MANAPLSGQDGANFTGDLGQPRKGMFLRQRLDEANHVEAATENRFCAHTWILPVVLKLYFDIIRLNSSGAITLMRR